MALVKLKLCEFDQEQVHLMKNTAVEIEMYKHVLSFFTGTSRFSKVSDGFLCRSTRNHTAPGH